MSAGPRGIFISYRRDDVGYAAEPIRDKLLEHFPNATVYFDLDQPAGIDWEARIRERVKQADVFLVVIGPRWRSELTARVAAYRSSGKVDYVRREIEWALGNWTGVVIPVLVDTTMPNPGDLPRSIKGLARKQAVVNVTLETLDDDIGRLLRTLEELSTPAAEPEGDGLGDTAPAALDQSAEPHDNDHYREVVEEMLKGTIVPMIGPAVRGAPPDSRFLAEELANKFPELRLKSASLTETAQSIAVMKSERQLRTTLGELIESYSEPIDVHRFLASFPGLLRRRGLDVPYQLIVSTNYDRALERAFEEVNEPFEYVIYMPSASHFVHFPWGEDDDEPRCEPIVDPAGYEGFHMSDRYELQRTVIVKLNGAPSFWEARREWPDDYVITEDQYIDYRPSDLAGTLLPREILDKLIGSECLFLGYPLSDWSTRVLLRRIWQGLQIQENSWVIVEGPSELEKRAWRTIPRVELFDANPSEYVDRLRSALDIRLRELTAASAAA